MEVTDVSDAVSTDFDSGVVRQAGDEPLNALELVSVIDRAEQDVFAAWVSGDCVRLHLGNE